MASYVYLTPPGAAPQDERTLVLRDGFSILTFLVPPVWFAFHRLWFEAGLSLALLVLAGLLSGSSIGEAAGPALSLAVSLFCGLEGRALRIAALERQGFTLDSVVEAANRDEADEIYFSGAPLQTRTPVNSVSIGQMPVAPHMNKRSRPVLGLFDLKGGR